MLKIYCKEKLDKALQEGREHYDDSLRNCIARLVERSLSVGARWNEDGSCTYDEDSYVEIFSDFGKDFGFSEVRSDGSVGLRGGIVFHGYAGEADNSFSVTFDNKNAWQIHT